MARGALGPGDQLFQAFPMGGKIASLSLLQGKGTEFVPADSAADLFWVETPALESGLLLHTNTATFPGLVDGAAVTPEHCVLSVRVPSDSIDQLGFDRQNEDVRFFYALVDAAPSTVAAMKFMRGAK